MSIEEARRRLQGGEAPRVAVVGAGVSGRAAAQLLAARGAEVRVFDERVEAVDRLPEARRGGFLEASALEGFDAVVLSPGVPRAHPALTAAIEADVVVGEVELASWFFPGELVGITGTNGKSTVTALVGHLLETAGQPAFVGGNLGAPLSEGVATGPFGRAVVELSSYQLESIRSASFVVGAWLNLAPDHLDRYPDLDAYAAAKQRLFGAVAPIGLVVANADDEVVRAAALGREGRRRWFGTEIPDGGEGTQVQGIRLLRGDEAYVVDGPGLLGPHNCANAAAAVEIVRELGVAPEAVQAGLSTYRALPHRLALVHEGQGIRWYDDSKATNVASAVTSVNAMERPTWLIAGGVDKGGSWAPLVEAAKGRLRGVFAIGEAASIVEAAFDGQTSVRVAGTLEEAVRLVREAAATGEAVLLAPACASFDQFASYAERGERFARLARDEVES